MSQACSSQRHSAFTSSTSRNARAIPDRSALLQEPTPRCGITTGIAMVFILKGKVQEHRQWMTRSFAVALVFLEGRVIGGVTGWEDLGVHANENIVLACLALSILSAELVLLGHGLGGVGSEPY